MFDHRRLTVTVCAVLAVTAAPSTAHAEESQDASQQEPAPAEQSAVPEVTDPAPAADAAQVPLHMFDAGAPNPVVFISVNGGNPVPVQVDTGSTGLVLIDREIPRDGIEGPVSSGVAGYNGLHGQLFGYDTYRAPVAFCRQPPQCDNAVVTERPVAVDVVRPESDQLVADYFGDYAIHGVLGVGPNNGFPGTSTVVAALPGLLGDGVLIDEPGRRLVFGPNPLPVAASAPGSPFIDAQVSVGGNPPVPVRMSVDSGGGPFGVLPAFVAPTHEVGERIPPGTDIAVHGPDGTLLYAYTTSEEHSPVVVDRDTASSGGVFPFSTSPVYIAHRPEGMGRTVIDR